MRIKTVSILALLAAMLVASLLFVSSSAQAQTLPNETPEKFTPTNDGFDYVRREVMIPDA